MEFRLKYAIAGVSLTLLSHSIAIAQTQLSNNGANAFTNAFEQALESPGDKAAFDAFLAQLPKDGELYVIEGDILASETEVRTYLISLSRSSASDPANPELRVNNVDGKPKYWDDFASRDLSYSIDKSSFAPNEYLIVKAAIQKAASDWQAACPECGVHFTYKEALDGVATHDDVLFIVRRVSNKSYVARAFFPGDSENRRYLDVDGSYFNMQFDRIGVMRHELGHVLGYRHEHIVGVRGCFLEANNWTALTAYDPLSVMHYFCGGKGTLLMRLSATDIAGHKKLYLPN